MTEMKCLKCKKIMIKDWEKFLEESKEKYIQCPYCNSLMPNPKFVEIILR